MFSPAMRNMKEKRSLLRKRKSPFPRHSMSGAVRPGRNRIQLRNLLTRRVDCLQAQRQGMGPQYHCRDTLVPLKNCKYGINTVR